MDYRKLFRKLKRMVEYDVGLLPSELVTIARATNVVGIASLFLRQEEQVTSEEQWELEILCKRLKIKYR